MIRHKGKKSPKIGTRVTLGEIIKIKMPEEFEESKEKIEKLVNREAEEVIKKG